MSDEATTGCGYQGYEFGAGSYPDSVCCGGQLFDADNCDADGNLYEPLEHIPCPICCESEAVDYWTERHQLNGTSRRNARRSAKALVADIRMKRGVEDRSEPR